MASRDVHVTLAKDAAENNEDVYGAKGRMEEAMAVHKKYEGPPGKRDP